MLNLSNSNRSGPFSAVLATLLGIVRSLMGFFTLTDEEAREAGVFDGRRGRSR
jgi:hypothetical protein